jgi:dipeptidyl aminopeptidase/acylaminoacyl peptidase
MHRDVRGTGMYVEAEQLYTTLQRPGTGQLSDATSIHASSDGRFVAFAGVIVDKLEGSPPTRVCLTELATGDTRVITFGPNMDRSPKFSPDCRHIAFLSDRQKAGDFQLYILNLADGAARKTPPVKGWVEYLHWSPDGGWILLGVAGHGADTSVGQGAVATQRDAENDAEWMPTVEAGNEGHHWRRVWVYNLKDQNTRQVSRLDVNVWEASWAGNDALAAVVSPGPREGLWYSARLALIEIESGEAREIYLPVDQLGWPSGSSSGKYIAVIEALCSDRCIVAGQVRLFDTESGSALLLDTQGVDVTYCEWRSDTVLLLAGHREFETVIGTYDRVSEAFVEVWNSQKLTTGGFYATVTGLPAIGDCALVCEGFLEAPEIGIIRKGRYRSVKSFALDLSSTVRQIVEAVEPLTWTAPDGLAIQGWLLRPKGVRPYPLLLSVHGGPVWQFRPGWLGRHVFILMLLKRGYAILFPNPRGSSGRGLEFARKIKGDLGGAETGDLLSGIDALINQGVADPNRLGVFGGSHGAFMTSWLITQDTRFSAAVSMSPITNPVSEYLMSNIPDFLTTFLADKYNNKTGKYFERSPIMHAHKAKTPTLNICGALDRCTPAAEAIQFHNALLGNGVESVLVTYPQEGHGVAKFPAAIDHASRVVSWFEDHMKTSSDS